MKKYFLISIALLSLLFISQQTSSHCEVPCGIYDDELRIDLIYEHITTIEKAMKQVADLESQSPVNYNQMVRWINTKEEHANEIQHIVSQYFMAQRIKAVDHSDQVAFDKYILQLTSLHQIIVYAMKSKQGIDLTTVEMLKELTAGFEVAYFGEHRHERDGDHK